jgi:phage-related protein
MVQAVGSVLRAVVRVLQEALMVAVRLVMQVLAWVVQQLGEILGQVVEILQQALASVLQLLGEILRLVMRVLASLVQQLREILRQALASVAQLLGEILQPVLLEALHQLVQPLLQGTAERGVAAVLKTLESTLQGRKPAQPASAGAQEAAAR